MDAGVPDYDGSHSIASMLRYFSSVTDEMMEKSGGYIFPAEASFCLLQSLHNILDILIAKFTAHRIF